jgi:FAD/FMN-containing dehydrogenase
MSSSVSLAAPSLLATDDPRRAAHTSTFSVLVDQRPELVVAATSADEVAAAVRHAAAHDLVVRVQATGHGCAEIEDGLLVSTRDMTTIDLDPATGIVTVGAGVRMRDLVEAASPHGLAPRCGSSPDVGVVGFTLGGGMPITARSTGYNADAMLSADVVLADGRQVRVDATSEPELFWALRGGKGPFCIVTALTLQLDRIATVYGGALYYAGEHARTVLRGYRDWTATLPEEMSTSVALYRLPPLPEVPEPLRGVLSVAIRIVHVGDAAKGAALVAPMQEVAPVIFGGTGEMPYAATAIIYNDPAGPLPAVTTGGLLRELTDADIDALLAVVGPDQNVPVAKLEIRHLGGALARARGGMDAVSGRHGAWVTHTAAIMTPELVDVTPHVLAAIDAALAPAAAGGGQVNFSDHLPATDVWGPEALTRLMAVKQAYDPANRFRGPLNFAPALPKQA